MVPYYNPLISLWIILPSLSYFPEEFMIRPAMKWESHMLAEAKLWASRSKDPSTKVGAVIYNPDRYTVVTTGYNGFPRGVMDHAKLYADREQKYPRVVHAEANAVVDAAYQGKSTKGMALASTHPLCGPCAGLIIQAGITSIIYEFTGEDMKRHAGLIAMEMLKEAHVKVQGVTL
jgi:dCMP deaminase